ncbi:fibronectin type III domain-containing protein [Paenibacillus ottowii]|nr:fibronectin type III domain-containing protein [Paenibacillus ottowii]
MYDDRSPELIYGNDMVKIADAEDCHKTVLGAAHNKPSTINFKFDGTKIRLIINMSDSYTKKVGISIDGNVEYFTAYRESWSHQRLAYEKTDLKKGVHIVKIWTETPSENYVVYDYRFDAIDIDSDGTLIDYNASQINLNAEAGNSQVTLKWNQVKDSESYTIKYGTESGKYTETVTATKDAYGNFVIPGLTNGTKYYFVVSAKVNGADSEYSNETSAIPQGGDSQTDPEQPTGNRAILVVTMTTGLEKEFDLSMKEVNDFIAWYNSKQAGSGSASYAVNKHDNNKGPFSSRKDYMLYDRILTFEVSEYSK